MAANPPTSGSKIPASVPPATMMSASPRRMISDASPRAWPPVAQAETVAKLGPVMPKLMAIWPAPMLGMPIGMRNGLIRSGPRRALVDMPSYERPDATEPGPEDHAGRLGERRPRAAPGRPAWSMRLAGGDEAELDVAVRAALVLAIEDAARVEVVDLGGDPRRSGATDRTPRWCGRRSARRRGPPRCVATSLPSAVSMPIPVRRTPARAPSSDQLPGPDRRGPIDVARQAARGDRVGDRQRVELRPPDLGGHLAVLDVDERPRRRWVRRRRRSPPTRR